MTNTELAVLSLVAEQPRHGYEIEQIIEERGMRDWTEVGFSSIYYILKKLEEYGWVEGHLEPTEGRGPARKVFAITAAGRERWHAMTLEALSVPQRCYTPLQLGLANLPGLPPREALAALLAYREQLAERRAYVQARAARNGEPLPFHVHVMFDFSLTMIEAELGWTERLIAQIERKEEIA